MNQVVEELKATINEIHQLCIKATLQKFKGMIRSPLCIAAYKLVADKLFANEKDATFVKRSPQGVEHKYRLMEKFSRLANPAVFYQRCQRLIDTYHGATAQEGAAGASSSSRERVPFSSHHASASAAHDGPPSSLGPSK